MICSSRINSIGADPPQFSLNCLFERPFTTADYVLDYLNVLEVQELLVFSSRPGVAWPSVSDIPNSTFNGAIGHRPKSSIRPEIWMTTFS